MSPELRQRFDAQYAASRAQPETPVAVRRDRLLRLQALIDQDGPALIEAVQADFGVRSAALTDMADLLVVRVSLKDALHNLTRWSRPQRVRSPLQVMPARGWIQRQPLGVVGVISPWNYPLQLALVPVASALAAGNRVMLKPSELTPRTSALLAELVARHFAPDELCVLNGDAHLAAEFSALPFDHLFFTGSTAVGRKVAAAAAQNLTPTTLELGGKSPCLIHDSANLDKAALRIAHGKLLNAGQTCIAPDYLLLPRALHEPFAQAFERAAAQLFPRFAGNADYASLISERHAQRLQGLWQEAEAQGAELRVMPGGDDPAARQWAPRLLLGATRDMRVMQEEIFGPVLPLVACESTEEAIAFINAGPRPLALYWFGDDNAASQQVLQHTVSGGVTLNDTLMHIVHEGLPFGGVGDSGWGVSHGEAGFLRFTHQKGVLSQSRWSASSLLYPPYGERFKQVMGLLRRVI